MAGQPGQPQNSFGWPSSFLAGLGPLGSLTPEKGVLDSDFMFVNIEPYKSKKCGYFFG